MKKLIMICTMLFGMVAFAQAQDNGQGRMGGRGMMNPESRVKQLDEKLKLNDEQKSKLTAIFKEQADEQKKMREEMQNGGNRSAMRDKMQKMRADSETKINGVLNDTQKAAYKTMLEEQRAEMQKRMQERGQAKNN